jgi:hypothetical protein
MKLNIVKIQVWWGSIMTCVNGRLMNLCIQIVTYTSVKALRYEVVQFITHSRAEKEGSKESNEAPEGVPADKRQNLWRNRHPEKVGRK